MHPHPPKPRLTLRVGITGHRPNKLHGPAVPRIQQQLRDVMGWIDDAAARILLQDRQQDKQQDRQHDRPPELKDGGIYADDVPIVRLVSGFAEGADQMAVAACPANWVIEAILPFPEADYLDDFKTSAAGDGRDVRDAFRASLAKAQVKTELPGRGPGNRDLSYADAGSYLLRQIDVLIA